jgi:uncharacterized membrane protein YccC
MAQVRSVMPVEAPHKRSLNLLSLERLAGNRVMSGTASPERCLQMSRQPEEALEVLREVWSAQGQTSADLAEALGTKKSCKNMTNVGFDGLADTGGDLRSAWRARLEREGS